MIVPRVSVNVALRVLSIVVPVATDAMMVVAVARLTVNVKAWGLLQNRSGKVTRQFSADLNGAWDGKKLILKDTSDTKWVNLHELKAEYTILYFWDPECGHCKTITPKLAKLYKEKMKARNVEVYSVGKAIGKDFEAWKKFIRENKLDFINVAVTDNLYKIAKEKPESLVPLKQHR